MYYIETRKEFMKKTSNEQKRILLNIIEKQERNRLRRKNKKYDTLKCVEKFEIPENFCIQDSNIDVFDIVNKLDELIYTPRAPIFYKKGVFVNMKKIKLFDQGSILILFSRMKQYTSMGIPIRGNFPKDSSQFLLLLQSNFFSFLNEKSARRNHFKLSQLNDIFSDNDIDIEWIDKIIAAKTGLNIWGKIGLHPDVNTVMSELMENTAHHANPNSKIKEYWWISVYQDRQNKVTNFVFLDNGQGIIESVSDSLRDKNVSDFIYQHILKATPGKILRNMADDKISSVYKTSTGKEHRGKGLPGIKKIMDRGLIKNLEIYSNNGYVNFGTNKYGSLDKNFSGTIIMWQIDETCR